MFGSVMHGKSLPQNFSLGFPITIHQSLTTMNIQIVHHQVNRLGLRIIIRYPLHKHRPFPRGALLRYFREVFSRLGFHSTKNVSRAATLIFLVQFRHAPHFFPAKAAGRGFATKHEWFLAPPAPPTPASPPLLQSTAPSSALAQRADSRIPWQ